MKKIYYIFFVYSYMCKKCWFNLIKIWRINLSTIIIAFISCKLKKLKKLYMKMYLSKKYVKSIFVTKFNVL